MRGGAEQFIEETERSLHDAIMIVRRAIKNDSVVAGTELLTFLPILHKKTLLKLASKLSLTISNANVC